MAGARGQEVQRDHQLPRQPRRFECGHAGLRAQHPSAGGGHDGKPYPWSIYYTDGPQVYRISHTKDLESGFFEERVGAMLKAVPKTNSIQLDTFRPFSISFGPGENIGLVDEVVSSARIVEWFHQQGIAVSSEGPVDALYGVLDAIYHLFVRDGSVPHSDDARKDLRRRQVSSGPDRCWGGRGIRISSRVRSNGRSQSSTLTCAGIP